jgi:hypothetical protein
VAPLARPEEDERQGEGKRGGNGGWECREPGQLVKDGGRGRNDFCHVLLDTWRLVKGDGRD